MIQGIGIDMVDISLFREQLADIASTFLYSSFTSTERSTVESRPARDKTHHLAARYAAKEAFIKAWSSSRPHQEPTLNRIDMREIEVVNDEWGRPSLRLHGDVKQAFSSQKYPPRIHLSLSHDGKFSAAFVVLEDLQENYLKETLSS